MARTLVVMPSVHGVPDGDGFFLDRKAVEGLKLYADLWPGPVRCLFRSGERQQIAFGASYSRADLPFDVRIVPAAVSNDAQLFEDAALILASGDSHLDLDLSRSVTAPVVYIIEYTLATRLRINRLYNGLSLRALKSAVWELRTERRRRRAFRQAAGLQCNGTPAYEAYRTLVPDALLYFDTRTTNAQQIDAESLAAKLVAIRADEPLRLAFSGRLDRMKGTDHLVPVAAALARRGVDFTLDIFGDGSLRSSMVEQASAAGLSDRITIHGPVSFEDRLVPTLIRDIDLFVCCHRQGDPSCTYTETLSCGVPIVGYANEAFTGILARADVGTAVPMDDIERAAAAIASLAVDRNRLAELSANAARFGRDHSFEREFAERVNQLRRIAAI